MRVAHGDTGPEAMYRLGRYNHGKANYTEAIAAYRKALEANPNHVEACNGLAVSYSMQGQYELALQYLRRALGLSPNAAHLHNNLGYIHMTEGRINEAAAAFEQALRLDPENRWARGNVAALYEKVGLNADAVNATLPGFLPADVAVSVGPPVSAVGVSSASLQANVAAPAERKHGRQGEQGEQGVGGNAGARLVQVAPNVFEFRQYKDGLGDRDSHPANRGENTAASGISIPDSKAIRIEVSNGSGIAGMARQVSNFLRENGLPQARLTDRQPFRQLQTEIHYRPGSYKLAEQIGRMMPKQISMKEGYNLRKDIQVRILLGKDITSAIADSNILHTVSNANVQMLGKS
jgi:tetratricopeptide (TPR) repeat protein